MSRWARVRAASVLPLPVRSSITARSGPGGNVTVSAQDWTGLGWPMSGNRARTPPKGATLALPSPAASIARAARGSAWFQR